MGIGECHVEVSEHENATHCTCGLPHEVLRKYFCKFHTRESRQLPAFILLFFFSTSFREQLHFNHFNRLIKRKTVSHSRYHKTGLLCSFCFVCRGSEPFSNFDFRFIARLGLAQINILDRGLRFLEYQIVYALETSFHVFCSILRLQQVPTHSKRNRLS